MDRMLRGSVFRRLVVAALVVFCAAPAAAEQFRVPGFGTLTATKTADGYTVKVGKYGPFTFRGTLSPPELEAVVPVEGLRPLPGYGALARLGLVDVRLKLSGAGLTMTADADTRRSLGRLFAALGLPAPRVTVTAVVTTDGFSLAADLSPAGKPPALTIVPGLGTRLTFDKLTLRLDVGIAKKEEDDKAGKLAARLTNTRPSGGKPAQKKPKTPADYEATPVVTVHAQLRLQPTKWDPALKTELEFSYNLATQELTASGSMVDTWRNPLGLKLVFGDRPAVEFVNAAVEIGWIPGSPTPTKLGFYLEKARFFGLEFGVALAVAPADGSVALRATCAARRALC